MKRRGAAPLIIIVLVAVVALGATLAVEQLAAARPRPAGRVLGRAHGQGRPARRTASTRPRRSSASASTASASPSPRSPARATTSSCELPGVKDRKKAQQIVGQTAKLEFRPVLASSAPAGYDVPAAGPGAGRGPRPARHDDDADHHHDDRARPRRPPRAADGAVDQPRPTATHHRPATDRGTDDHRPRRPTASSTTTTTTRARRRRTAPTVARPTEAPATAHRRAGAACRSARSGFEGDSLSRAKAELDTTTGAWKVAVAHQGQREGEANELFNACYAGSRRPAPPSRRPSSSTARCSRHPDRAGPEPGRRHRPSQITGDFSQSEAKDLALVLRYGALPVEFERSAEQQVSATLGRRLARRRPPRRRSSASRPSPSTCSSTTGASAWS